LSFYRIAFPLATEELIFTDLLHYIAVAYVKFVALHDDEVAVRYLFSDLFVGQVQRVHERCYLSEEAGVAYCRGFAVSLDTLLVKTDSLEKFPTSIRLIAPSNAEITSCIVPWHSSSARLSSPMMK